MTLRRRRRYRGMLSGALLVVVAGVFLGDRWAVVLAAVPLVFLAFDALSGVPAPELAVERDVTPRDALPDDRVRVELTIRNEGSTIVPDLRVGDGVPEGIEVVDGAAATSAALRPGGETTLEYAVRARRGTHEFEPPRVRVRGTAAGSYRDRRPAVEGDTRLTARLFVEDPPTVREASTLVGGVTADTGGSGVEFRTVRQYRPGDPINRVDWRRLARNGTLSTVDFREQGGLSVVVVADCRREAEFVPASGGASSRTLSLYAAERVVAALASEGGETGLLALGSDTIPWVAPGSSDLRVRTRRALRAAAGDRPRDGASLPVETPDDGTVLAERLLTRLRPGTQVVVTTPLADGTVPDLAADLRVHGHPVTVLSPDVGPPASPGARLVRLEREARITRLRDAGATVVDWPRAEPLAVALSGLGDGEAVGR